MTELKCPFCGEELNIDPCGEMGCPNEKCKESVFLIGTKELWEAFIVESAEHSMCHTQMLKTTEELERTREKLNYAITMLERIAVSPETMLEPEKVIPQLAALALEQIEGKE